MSEIDTSAPERDIAPGMVALIVEDAARSPWRSVNQRAILALATDRDRLAARVAELEGALRAALPFVETAERCLRGSVSAGVIARAALAGSARDDR